MNAALRFRVDAQSGGRGLSPRSEPHEDKEARYASHREDQGKPPDDFGDPDLLREKLVARQTLQSRAIESPITLARQLKSEEQYRKPDRRTDERKKSMQLRAISDHANEEQQADLISDAPGFCLLVHG